MRYFIFAIAIISILSASMIVTSTAQTVDRSWLQEDSWPALAKREREDIPDNEEKLTKIKTERYNACLMEFRDRYIFWLQGTGTLREVCENADRLVDTRASYAETPRERIDLQQQKLEFAERLLAQAEKTRDVTNRTQSHIDARFALFYKLNVEVDLQELSQN